MSEVREIVTRAVLAKGRKTFKINEVITLENEPYSILGCWVINHDFNATENNKCVKLNWNSNDLRIDETNNQISINKSPNISQFI